MPIKAPPPSVFGDPQIRFLKKSVPIKSKTILPNRTPFIITSPRDVVILRKVVGGYGKLARGQVWPKFSSAVFRSCSAEVCPYKCPLKKLKGGCGRLSGSVSVRKCQVTTSRGYGNLPIYVKTFAPMWSPAKQRSGRTATGAPPIRPASVPDASQGTPISTNDSNRTQCVPAKSLILCFFRMTFFWFASLPCK